MKFDERSEKNIATLHPDVQQRASAFLLAAKSIASKRGLDVRVISGTRSYIEQDALYAKGRTEAGKIVTNAKAGFSNHNFGLAWDIGIFSTDGKKYYDEHPLYGELGVLGKSLGLEWGGNWKTIVDEPHYQFRPKWAIGLSERDMLAELRRRVANKIDIL